MSFIWQNHIIDFSALEYYNPGKPSILLDDQGNEWARFELDRRDPLPFSDIPQHLIHAVIATEDRNFFSHHGISVRGIIRSMAVNLYKRRFVQGASTITQQLVRLLFFDARQTVSRKIKEQIVALLVEKQFTKEQILQTYLNHVCFGCGIYGVEAASQRFWSKSARDITVAEAAILASTLKNPSRYCLLNSTENVRNRRDTMLAIMKRMGFITQRQYEQGICESIEVIQKDKGPIAPHFKETIRIFLENEVGKARLYCGGLTIQTTLNTRTQRAASKHFKRQFASLRERISNKIDGGLLSVDPQTGEMRALVGGYDFEKSKFNRALQARRQMGSIFKPLVFACALKKGASFGDVDKDEPIDLLFEGSTWSPRNYTRSFEGDMTLARALSMSINTITAKTFLRAGVDKVVDLAKRCHLAEEIAPYPSLALGCLDVTIKQAIGALGAFANDGYYVEPHMLKWVKDEFGSKIYRFEPTRKRVLEPRIVGQVAKVLSIGITRYLKTFKVTDFKSEAFGKTGTTNDSRTCWFCGSTPKLMTIIYAGRDDNSSLGQNVYPLSTIFPIWLNLYKAIEREGYKFTYDPSLKESVINWKTGEPVYRPSNSPDVVSIYT
ncbi:MAG TPA: transglycosylase domain-containing protein [Candidatus Babeliales bacterium]|nr:transglycosylase domain-containing protein [Candidatus Babeliales bacterium]